MQKEYGRAVRSLFARGMLQAPFGWEPMKLKTRYLFGGELPFRHVTSETLHPWALLVPSTKLDSFTVEVGWSHFARFPELSSRPMPCSAEDALNRDEGILRLGHFSHGHDHWWPVEQLSRSTHDIETCVHPVTSSEADGACSPAVAEALSALQQYGLPYLRRVVERSVRGEARASLVRPST